MGVAEGVQGHAKLSPVKSLEGADSSDIGGWDRIR